MQLMSDINYQSFALLQPKHNVTIATVHNDDR